MSGWRKTAMGLVGIGLIGLGLIALLRLGYGALRRASVEPYVAAASERYGVDAGLIRAVIWRESRFRPRERGGAGERGLMQVTEAAAWEWAVAEGIEPFRFETVQEPGPNVLAGTWYLARALAYWSDRDDPVPFALAEYNAGRTHALRWAAEAEDAAAFMEAITYPGTRRYIRQVLQRWRRAPGPGSLPPD